MKFTKYLKVSFDTNDLRVFDRLYVGSDVELSIQASKMHYCIPKATLPVNLYTHYELAIFKGGIFTDASIVKKFPRYKELVKHQDGEIFTYVPRDLVNDLFSWCKIHFDVTKDIVEVAIEELVKQESELPPKGEVWYDSNDRIICHICGKSFNKLSAHIIQAHNITPTEYKDMFELNRGEKLTSKGMREYFRSKPRKDITKYSKNTQYKEGHTSVRKGKPARLQAILNRPIEYNKGE